MIWELFTQKRSNFNFPNKEYLVDSHRKKGRHSLASGVPFCYGSSAAPQSTPRSLSQGQFYSHLTTVKHLLHLVMRWQLDTVPGLITRSNLPIICSCITASHAFLTILIIVIRHLFMSSVLMSSCPARWE